MIDLGGLIFLLLIIAAFVGLIMLQVKLSKKEAVMPGLILPIISFVFALLVGTLFVVNMTVTSSGGTVVVSDEECYDGYEHHSEHHSDDCDNNVYIEEYSNEAESEGSAVVSTTLGFIFSFAFCMVPCIVYLLIYFACHPTKKKLAKKAELEKMSINDL